MRHITVLIALLVAFAAAPVAAQTTIPTIGTEQLAWDQAAPDLATAQGYQYVPLVDTATVPAAAAALTGVTCAGTASPFTCTAPLVALTPGTHEIRLVARVTAPTGTLTSPASAPLAVLMHAVPVAPANVRLVAS